MSSLRNILFVRIYSFTLPASCFSIFNIQFRAGCGLMAILFPRNTIACYFAAPLLLLTALENKTRRGATEVEEGEKVAAVIIVAGIAACLGCGVSFVYFVQQIFSCGVAEEIWYGAVGVMNLNIRHYNIWDFITLKDLPSA